MKRSGMILLVHLVSLVIAVPVGWCCRAPLIQANEDSGTGECCCCAERKNPPSEAPAPPTCCCEPTPAAVLGCSQDEIKQAASEPLAAASWPTVYHSFASAENEQPVVISLGRSPPIHVLHCVWLC
jgi:hypothetical protein